jgi:hypothetical protein
MAVYLVVCGDVLAGGWSSRSCGADSMHGFPRAKHHCPPPQVPPVQPTANLPPTRPDVQVFVWEDQDEDAVGSYKVLESHAADILAMAAHGPRQLLATGKRGAARVSVRWPGRRQGQAGRSVGRL